MASYRFCRSDDLPLLVAAHNACYRPHFPGLPPLTVDDIKRAARELDLWSSSCMVAADGDDCVAVLLATKRDEETLILRLGTHPDHQRQGHARHLLTSLSAKLAILGPPRLVAEVPESSRAARALFEACGWHCEVEYTDFLLEEGTDRGAPSDLVIPVTVDELIANDACEWSAQRPWDRSTTTLVKRKDSIRGLAVASDARLEAWLLYEEPAGQSERLLLAFGCADPSRREMWGGLLVRRLAAGDARPLRYDRVRSTEIPFELLQSWGFVPGGRTLGYAATPRPA